MPELPEARRKLLKRLAPFVLGFFVVTMSVFSAWPRYKPIEVPHSYPQTSPRTDAEVRQAEQILGQAEEALAKGEPLTTRQADEVREVLTVARGAMRDAKQAESPAMVDREPPGADPLEVGAKMLVSALVLTFAFILLMANTADESTKTWAMSIIGTVVGFWLGSAAG